MASIRRGDVARAVGKKPVATPHKYKKWDRVHIKRITDPKHPDYEAQVDYVYPDGDIRISNINMPYCGSICGAINPDEIEPIEEARGANGLTTRQDEARKRFAALAEAKAARPTRPPPPKPAETEFEISVNVIKAYTVKVKAKSTTDAISKVLVMTSQEIEKKGKLDEVTVDNIEPGYNFRDTTEADVKRPEPPLNKVLIAMSKCRGHCLRGAGTPCRVCERWRDFL